MTVDREEADVYPKSGFSITPADFAAAAPCFAAAADALAAVAQRVLADLGECDEDVRRAESLVAQCVRRLRELESAASGVAVAYQRTDELIAGGFR